MGKVKFYLATQDQYDRLGIKDDEGFYFISDTRKLYKGESQIVGDISILPIASDSTLGGVKVSATKNMDWIQENYPDLDIPGDVMITISDGASAGKLFLNASVDNFTNNQGIFELKPASVNNVGGIAASLGFADTTQIESYVNSVGVLKGVINTGSIEADHIADGVIPKDVKDLDDTTNRYVTPAQLELSINQAVASTYRVKGSTTRVELPEDAVIGDVWNLTDEDGQNVVWTGANGWDNLGSTIDLTWDAIQGKPTQFEAIPHRHDNVTSAVDGFMSKEDKVKLDGIEQYANNYSLPVSNSTTLGGVKLQPGTSTNYTSVNINNSQFAYVDYATDTTPGTVKPGQYMSVAADGTMDCNIPWNELG